MSRQNKIKSLQIKEKNQEAFMTKETELENFQTEIDLAREELEKTKREIEEKKKELETCGRREISEQEKKIVEKQITATNERNASNSLIEKQKAFDNVMVTGKFINRRSPGQPAKLTYLKYIDDPVKWYLMEDGKVYTIPRGFADQINEYYHTPHFIQKQGPMDPNAPSTQIHEVDTSNKKYSFVPINF